jgi:hypothetical protein
MHTAEHYRAKASQMLKLAEEARTSDMRHHWATMADEWALVAERAEGEERVIVARSPHG